MRRLHRVVAAVLIGLAAFAGMAPAQADELPTFTLRFKPDGTFEPASNEPVEFESIPLRKEKVLGPGVKSFVVITISRPGEYPFFDDFHQSVKGTLVVKPKE